MATFVIWCIRIFGLFLFAVLSMAAYNMYTTTGALLFASIVGATIWGFQSLVTFTFKSRRRSKFLREYKEQQKA